MKKTIWGFLTVVAMLIIVTQCKKSLDPTSININPGGGNNNNNNNSGKDTASPSPVGVPTGPSVTQVIGATGGTISTADGKVVLTVPSGALASSTSITIQNITNTALTSNGDAYRFLPNGLKFSSPVTIQFHYTDDDVNGSMPALLGIAFQDSANFWEPIVPSGLDTVSKTVSAQTSHFTDYLSYKTVQMMYVDGDLIAKTKLFVNRKETFAVYAAHKSNVGLLEPLNTSYTLQATEWSVNGVANGNATFGTVSAADLSGSENIISAKYTAPAQRPGSADNPVTLKALVHLPHFKPWVLDIVNFVYNGPLLNFDIPLTYKIRILDYNVYRLDIVDFHTLGCGAVINYYDSTAIFFRVGPDDADSYDIPQDSIENFPPGASPVTNSCGNCSYKWIAEPIGSVNIVSANVTFSGNSVSSGQFFVLLKCTEANENGVWYSVTCAGANGTEEKKPTFPTQTFEIPMQIDVRASQLDTTLEGSVDQSHIQLTLVKNGSN